MDFSRPGDDAGLLPAGFERWKSGVTCTVRPSLLAPLTCDRDYRINVNVLRKANQEDIYTDLYRRADDVATARIGELRCHDHDKVPHRWTIAQGWFRLPKAPELARASLTIGLRCPRRPGSKGEPPPTAEALRNAGGITPEAATSMDMKSAFPQSLDEIYSDFDVRDSAADDRGVSLFPYGEYVESTESVGFEPFVQRAEDRAKFHFESLRQSPSDSFHIVRREWFTAGPPDIVLVHVFFRWD